MIPLVAGSIKLREDVDKIKDKDKTTTKGADPTEKSRRYGFGIFATGDQGEKQMQMGIERNFVGRDEDSANVKPWSDKIS